MLDAHFLCSDLVENLAVLLPLMVGRPRVMVLREQCAASPMHTARAWKVGRHHRKRATRHNSWHVQICPTVPCAIKQIFESSASLLGLLGLGSLISIIRNCGIVTHFGLNPGPHKGITVALQTEHQAEKRGRKSN